MNKFIKIINAIKSPQFFKSYINLVCPLFEMKKFLKNLKAVHSIIDVGSNKGQFLILADKFFPKAIKFSFEPQDKPLVLQKKILKKKKVKFYRFGLGEYADKKTFYITNREDSSSFLKPNSKICKDYEIVREQTFNIKTLDSVMKNYNLKKKVLLKLDVQGYELAVLKGSLNTLKKVDYIILEISFKKIYKNQVSKNNLINFLKKNNFYTKDITNITKLKNDLFQADYLFEKKFI